MATVDETLAAFPEDLESESSSAEETPDLMHEVVGTAEPNPAEDPATCWLAMKAAWDTIRDSCGTGSSVEIGPVTIDVPAPIIFIVSGEGSIPKTRDKQIDTITDTNWCKKTAERMYSSMSAFEHDSPSYLTGLANVGRTIAEAVVNKFTR